MFIQDYQKRGLDGMVRDYIQKSIRVYVYGGEVTAVIYDPSTDISNPMQ